MAQSNTGQDGMGSERSGRPTDEPRALIHRKVLDAAAANPSASPEALATEVDGASTTFVEQILDEFGDPANGDSGDRVAGTDSSESRGTSIESDDSSGGPDGPETPDRDESGSGDDVLDESSLSGRQRATLRAIYEDPTATQDEIANRLGKSRATVSKRVNDLPGFEWKSRRDFVEVLFGERDESGGIDDVEPGDPVNLGDLEARVADVEAQIDAQPAPDGGTVLDPELLHKTVHACMDAEYVSQDEELRIIQQLLPGDNSIDR